MHRELQVLRAQPGAAGGEELTEGTGTVHPCILARVRAASPTLAGIPTARSGSPAPVAVSLFGMSARTSTTGSAADRYRGRAILAGVGLASFLGCLDLTVANTVAPDIGRDLGADLPQLQLVVNVVVVALSMLMVTAGRLSDRWGRRRVLLAGIVLFGLASAGAAVAGGAGWLIMFRFLQGAAIAVLYTGSGTIVAGAFPPPARGRAMGTLFALNGAGLAVGPAWGGVTVGLAGWRGTFASVAVLAAVALALCLVGLRGYSEGDLPRTRLDTPGLVLLGVTVAGTVTGLTFGDTRGWTDPAIVGSLLAGVLGLVGFVLAERRAAAPLVPLDLWRRGPFLRALTAEFALGFFYTTALFLLPLLLGIVRGLDDLGVGLMMLPATATVALASPLVGRLVDRVGPGPVLSAGLAAFAASGAVLATSGTGPVAVVVAALLLMGLGWAGVLGPSAVAALAAVPAERAGMAVGSTWTVHNLGGAIGLAVGLAVFRARVAGDLVAAGVPAGPAHAVATDPATGSAPLGGPDAASLLAGAVTSGVHASALLIAAVAAVAAGLTVVLGRGEPRAEAPAGPVTGEAAGRSRRRGRRRVGR